eukprot:TRINITY_DN4251_c1_g5_i1.p1 TRINITY_DN4251_c1_g5~~TRINITY_DN4251_c1_g5_i1.p1  ORF type:complete len:682 (-),score=164.67 TRINITY_DN4251_c1_g5_i1:289-2334(-)
MKNLFKSKKDSDKKKDKDSDKKKDKSKKVTTTEYTLAGEIAVGGLAKVYEGTWGDMKVALKQYKDKSKESTDSFVREVKALQKLRHPHVIQYYSHDTPSRTIIMELVKPVTLNEALWGKNWPLSNSIAVAEQISIAMKSIHKVGMVHLDLKSPNVLLVQDVPPLVKLIDFDSALIIDEYKENGDKIDLTHFVWTERWAAPERTQKHPVIHMKDLYKLDVFSFGVIMYELLVSQMPYPDVVSNKLEVAERYRKGERPSIPDQPNYPHAYVDLIKRCWEQKPIGRPDFDYISQNLASLKSQLGEAVSISSSISSDVQQLALAVEYEGVITLIKTTSSSTVGQMEGLVCEKLGIKGKIRLEYKDQTLGVYVKFDANAKNELVLEGASKILVRVIEEAGIGPWSVSPSKAKSQHWITEGDKSTPYRTMIIKDGKTISDEDEYNQVMNIVRKLHGEHLIDQITKIVMVHNDKLERAFEDYLDKLGVRWKSADKIFNIKSWEADARAEQRRPVYEAFKEMENLYLWNKNANVKVVPMLQGTSVGSVPHMSQTGFASTGLRDKGWFGNGIYWTSYMDYALHYARTSPGKDDECAMFITFLVPGNIYPVVETPNDPNGGLIGSAKQGGYQSHYVLVHDFSQSLGWPLKDYSLPRFDELVSFDEAQAVPKYVLYFKKQAPPKPAAVTSEN